MINNTFRWKTEDKKTLFARCWQPENDSKNTVLFIHGLGEHSGRYERWAELFVERGFNFMAFDLRGHGKSTGKHGHAASLDVILDDIQLVADHTRELFKETKLILYGQSMGGNLALNYIINRNQPVNALVITSPWLRLTKEPSDLILYFSGLGSKIFPSFTLGNGLNSKDFSHNPDTIKDFVNDPFNHNRISFRLFTILFRSGYHALRNVYKINYPFLLMHGSDDQITSPKASENYVMNTSDRTQFKLWKGAYHELHNELNYKEVFKYITDWLAIYNIK